MPDPSNTPDMSAIVSAENVDISGLDKAQVLLTLYRFSRPQGIGSFLAASMPPLTEEDARTMLNGGQKYFDYVCGHVIKCDLSGDSFDPRLYDRDNGTGQAKYAIGLLRRGLERM